MSNLSFRVDVKALQAQLTRVVELVGNDPGTLREAELGEACLELGRDLRVLANLMDYWGDCSIQAIGSTEFEHVEVDGLTAPAGDERAPLEGLGVVETLEQTQDRLAGYDLNYSRALITGTPIEIEVHNSVSGWVTLRGEKERYCETVAGLGVLAVTRRVLNKYLAELTAAYRTWPV